MAGLSGCRWRPGGPAHSYVAVWEEYSEKARTMKPEKLHEPIDIVDVEARARRMRAEAVARGVGAVGRWMALPFHRRLTV